MNAEPSSRTYAWYFLVLAVGAYMLLSAQMLLSLGIPYDAPFGPPVAKVHPGTYCLLLAWFLALISHGNPLAVLACQMQQHRLLATYFSCVVSVFIWVLLRHGVSGAAFIIEAMWTPAIAAFVLYLLDPARHRQIVKIVILLLLANAVLALGEVTFHARLTPLDQVHKDLVDEPYFRASAFLGHPLHNAMITVSLLPAVVLMPWSLPRRLVVILLMFLSILAFGGRASLVAGVAFYGALAAIYGMINVVRLRYSYLQLTGGALALMFGLTALIGIVASTGLGARIFENLQMDSSASVRLSVWGAFNYLSDTDWWIGVAPAQIDHISLRLGLDPVYEAIENFWIYLFLQFGIVGFIPFVFGLGCLLAVLWKAANPALRTALLVYFLVASSANTLASKTVSLMLLTLVIIAGEAFRQPHAISDVRAGQADSSAAPALGAAL